MLQAEASLDLSSDHSPIVVMIYDPQGAPTTDLALTLSRVNWLKYKKYVSTHCTQNISLTTPEELDVAINNFEEQLKAAARHATHTYHKSRSNRIFFANVEQLLAAKRRLRREWQQQRSPQLKSRLRECTRELRELLEAQRDSSLKNYLENLDATPQSNYSLWRAAKNIKRPVMTKPPLRCSNGGWARDDTEKGNIFADHLKCVFTPNTIDDIDGLAPVVARAPKPTRFQFQEIEKFIEELNPRKAPGIDRISNKMLLELPSVAKRIILFIFNAILRLEYYPAAWKVSLITMIPKPGKDHSKVESYRPISLLSTMSKLFEKIFVMKLTPLLNINSCIPDHQFGFRRQHSTIEQTHRLVQVIRDAFEKKKFCSALFIDVSQAFDKVWHDGLKHKLKLNLPVNVYQILNSYITDRQFVIKQGDYVSSPQPINAGVPQGSVLGPLLYLLYTADMPTSSRIHTSTFADDTAFISTHESPQEASRNLQQHIHQLEAWLTQWKIKVNEQKCTHITFTLRKESCPPVRINGQVVPQPPQVKYLGIHLDRRLTWKYHIDAKLTQMKLKASQLHWLIGRNSVLSLDCKLLLYNSFLKPIWSYGIQQWGTASASNVEKIQRRQNKILRMITTAPWYIKNSNIHKDLNVPTVKSEVAKYAGTYLKKLELHPNPLARNILNFDGHIRLKKRDTAALLQTDGR